MNKDQAVRTLQWIIIVFLLFTGPIGWILIYLLWKQWNPTAPLKKSAAKPKTKKAAAKTGAKTAVKKKKSA